MKKIGTTLSFVLFVTIGLVGQTTHFPNAIGFQLVGVDTYSPRSEELFAFRQQTVSYSLEYGRQLGHSFSVRFPFRFGKMNYPYDVKAFHYDWSFYSIDALLQYDLMVQPKERFLPYLFTGIGLVRIPLAESQWDKQFPIGLGVRVRIYKNVHLSINTEYRISADGIDNWHNGVGISIFWGKPREYTPSRTLNGISGSPTNLDFDQDGVPDNFDNCPRVEGTVLTAGCPDGDMDGVEDDLDKCPRVAGSAKSDGCPDSDFDGIHDGIDICPNEAGAEELNGCPYKDDDGDGLANIEDKCPDIAGVFELAGCPDLDGDFVDDRIDRCIGEKGNLKSFGCPDFDKDGVPDFQDDCPKIEGSASDKGCPILLPTSNTIKTGADANIFFETNSTVLPAHAYSQLDELADLMTAQPKLILIIEGHTDNTGEESVNLKVGLKRAKICYDYLLSKGVSETHISYNSVGSIRPLADNSLPEGRAKNRRVSFRLFFQD